MSVARLHRGLASSTTTSRPVFSTDSRIVSRSSGLTVRGIDDFRRDTGRFELGGGLLGERHHPPDRDDGDVVAFPNHVRLTERDGVALLGHVAGDVVHRLVLAEDHRVVVPDRLDEKAFRFVRAGRQHHLQARAGG